MKAMVFTGPSRMEMLDVEEPAAGAGEVVVEVATSGICGSELHGIQSTGFRKPPLIMGHEFAGTASDGRRVVINPLVACHVCDQCRRGRENLCRERSIVGIHRSGGFAERVAVPEANVYELPEDMSWERGAAVEPIANAVHMWRIAGHPLPGRVGVIGAGTIGLVCLLVAKANGAAEVAVSDLSDDRLEAARRLGASETGPKLEGEFDLVIDAVSVPATNRASVDAVRPGGTAVWIGLIGDNPDFDPQHLVRFEKRIQGSFCYTQDEFEAAIRLARVCDVSWVEPFPLSQGVDIFTELMQGRTDIVKAVLVP